MTRTRYMTLPGWKPRMLVVDDNRSVQEDIAKILRVDDPKSEELDRFEAELFGKPSDRQDREWLAELKINYASSGDEAIELASRQAESGEPYTIAFVDVRMPPGIDGIQTARRLREINPATHLVICSAFSDYSWSEIASQLGPAPNLLILRKPFSEDEVLQIVRAAISRYQQQKDQRQQRARLERSIERKERELQRNELLSRTMLESAPDAIMLLTAEGVIEIANVAAGELFGLPIDQLTHRPIATLIPELDDPLSFFGDDSPRHKLRTAGQTPEGELALQVTLSRIEEESEPDRILCSCQHIHPHQISTDIDENTPIEENRLAAAVSQDGLFNWNLESDEVVFSARFAEMLGFNPSEQRSSIHRWLGRIHPDEMDATLAAFKLHRGGRTTTMDLEFRMRHRDGSFRWVRCRGLALRNEAGQAHRIVGSIVDVTKAKALEEQLLKTLAQDRLTGLPNRDTFLEQLERAWVRSERAGSGVLAVLMLRLVRFRTVIQSVGHAVADQLLRTAAGRLKSSMASGDLLARYSDEEFVVLCEDLRGRRRPGQTVRQIQQQFSEPFAIAGQEVQISLRFGLAVKNSDIDSPEELVHRAAAALHRPKTGRSGPKVLPAKAKLKHGKHGLLQLEVDLRRAVKKSELNLVYQPIVSTGDRQIIGFEALLRWTHPKLGPIDPDTFIPLAEESGLLVLLGHSVLQDACLQLKTWQLMHKNSPNWSIHVNLSASQLRDRRLGERIDTVLEMTRLDPNLLVLELNEPAVLGWEKGAAELLSTLKASGVRIYLDDFGTGQSSLNVLNTLPIDGIKLDNSLVKSIEANESQRRFADAVVRLAGAFGIDAVAEGVETEKQLDLLKALKFAGAQGYLFSRPKSAEQLQVELGLRQE